MKIINNEDICFRFQPEKDFVKDLTSPIHMQKLNNFNKREPRRSEVSLKRIKLVIAFPDDENVLECAFKDFRAFLKSADIIECQDGMPIIIEFEKTEYAENFSIIVNKDKCLIKAGDTQGVRRALVFIEDEMKRRSAAFLPLGVINIKYKVKTRISRCFFTPPSHASSYGAKNELFSNIDYYPEEYLNRLAHDGTNGLWIGANFRTLLKSSFIPEYGKGQDTQIKKLNEIIARCKKYGIGIYLLVTEPASSYNNEDLLKHPELHGGIGYGEYKLFCASTEIGKKYIKEAITNLFTLVPELKGIINITVGESLSACGSTLELTCPKCLEEHKTHGRTLTATEKLMSDAMKEVAPNAEFISWTYAQRAWTDNDIVDACNSRDEGVIHMANFEDLGRPKQLGKKRLAYDYWLSYVGPGELMKKCAKINKKRGVKTFAKLQVCSSHEISTVPYVPVPGILYDKYKYIHKNDITGVVQCWYFGNYPSMMNKSASELALLPYYKNKGAFLKVLAKTYFNEKYSYAVKAWKAFEKGYKNFPVSVSFEWFGPMQDGPCKTLHLIPIDWPLSGTWLNNEQAGDRIGECLLNGHTLDEAITLVNRLCKNWDKGLSYLKLAFNDEGFNEQISDAFALGYIFRSGLNILTFYKLRHLLGIRQGDAKVILSKMKNIVNDEIAISEVLIPYVEKDKRLGYHSETNGYKIFTEKLKWRIESLKKLLETEFVEVTKRISNNQIPLAFYYGQKEGYDTYVLQENNESVTQKNFYLDNGDIDSKTTLTAFDKNGECVIKIRVNDVNDDKITIKPEFNIMFPLAPFTIEKHELKIEENLYFSFTNDKVYKMKKNIRFSAEKIGNDYLYTLCLNRKKLNIKKDEPFRLSILRQGKTNSSLARANKMFESQLIRGAFYPEQYCFFVKNQV